MGTVLLKMAARWVPEGPVVFAVDDTLANKTGRSIWGANMHHDPLHWMSNAVAFGHNWVVLALVVPVPLVTRPAALPVLFRFYRSKKTRDGRTRQGEIEQKTVGAASKAEYRTRPELAVELLHIARQALGPEAVMHLVGDTAYGGKSVTRHLPAKTVAISRMTMKAALYEMAPARRSGQKGCPRKKGRRVASPEAMARKPGGWRKATVHIHGKAVDVRYKTAVVLWYNSTHTMPVRMVLVRDPKGGRRDGCFFTTDPLMTPETVLETYALRWSIEVAFRDAKQLLGFERSQARTANAVDRTGPFAFVVYTIGVLWFAERGHQYYPDLIPYRPWYRHKRAPSCCDMLHILQTLLNEEDLLNTLDNSTPPNNSTPLNIDSIEHAA